MTKFLKIRLVFERGRQQLPKSKKKVVLKSSSIICAHNLCACNVLVSPASMLSHQAACNAEEQDTWSFIHNVALAEVVKLLLLLCRCRFAALTDLTKSTLDWSCIGEATTSFAACNTQLTKPLSRDLLEIHVSTV